MKTVISKGLLAAVIGALLCSTMANACPGDKSCGAGEKGAAKKEKVSEKSKTTTEEKPEAAKTGEKPADSK